MCVPATTQELAHEIVTVDKVIRVYVIAQYIDMRWSNYSYICIVISLVIAVTILRVP